MICAVAVLIKDTYQHDYCIVRMDGYSIAEPSLSNVSGVGELHKMIAAFRI